MTAGTESATQYSLSYAYFGKKCNVTPTHGAHVLLLGDNMVYPRENILDPCFEISPLHLAWSDIFDPVL